MTTFFLTMTILTVLSAGILAWGLWKESDGGITVGFISLFFLVLLGWIAAGTSMPVRMIETPVSRAAVERVSTGLVVGNKVAVTDHIEVVWFDEKVGSMWFVQTVSPYGNITSSRYEFQKNP